MRTWCILSGLLASVGAWAGQPAAYPAQTPAAAYPAPVQPAARPAAVPAASPAGAPRGVYQQYRPQARPTPSALSGDANVARVTIHKESVSVALKGGLAMRLGEEAKFHTAGFNTGVEFLYKASPELSADVFVHYSSIPYSLTTAAQPLTNMGVGIKAVYELFEVESVAPFIEGGLGYIMTNRATQAVKGTDPATGLPLFETKYQQAGGMAFLGGLGASYIFNPQARATLSLTVISVSLAGGTGDNVLYANPSLGLNYTF